MRSTVAGADGGGRWEHERRSLIGVRAPPIAAQRAPCSSTLASGDAWGEMLAGRAMVAQALACSHRQCSDRRCRSTMARGRAAMGSGRSVGDQQVGSQRQRLQIVRAPPILNRERPRRHDGLGLGRVPSVRHVADACRTDALAARTPSPRTTAIWLTAGAPLGPSAPLTAHRSPLTADTLVKPR